jgi:hypothetical protein
MFIYEAELLLMCHLRRTDFLKQFYQSSEQSIMNPQQEVQANKKKNHLTSSKPEGGAEKSRASAPPLSSNDKRPNRPTIIHLQGCPAR